MTTLHAVNEPDLTASALRISIRTVFSQFLLLLLDFVTSCLFSPSLSVLHYGGIRKEA
jgi:hypothetical protein